MFKNNLLKDYYKTGKVDGIILAIIIGIIFYNFITYEHFPHHDEVTSVTLLSSIKTSFIKFYGHNHLLSTQIGNLIIFLFGVDIMKIRLLSLISFFIILFLIQKNLKDYSKTFLFILIYLSVDIITTYYTLYRGYAVASLLFTWVFFLLDNKKNNLENSRLLFVILALLIIHSQTTIYLVAPIIIALNIHFFMNTANFKISIYKNFIFFFLLPFLFLFLIICLGQGIYDTKIFISSSNLKNVFPIILSNFFDILYNGFSNLVFNNANNVKLFSTLDKFLINLQNHFLFFFIFFISFLKSIYHIFIKKNFDIISLIIFIFFITFILINRNGPVRIYTGFVSFFIIYILRDINLDLLKNKIMNLKAVFKYSLILMILFKLNNIDFVRIDVYKEKYLFFKDNLENCDFPNKDQSIEFDKHFEYFVYLQECKKKPNINKFYIYYKS